MHFTALLARNCTSNSVVLFPLLRSSSMLFIALFIFQCCCFYTCSWRFYEIAKLNALHCSLSSVCFLAYLKQCCFQWWLWSSSTRFTAVLFTYRCASLQFAVGAKQNKNQTQRSLLFCFIFLFCKFLFKVFCTLVPVQYTSITLHDQQYWNQSSFTNIVSKMFSRREICFWKCARTIQNTQSVSSKLYSAQAEEYCYKRSGSEAQSTDCYTLLGFHFCSDYTITTRYNDFNCNHNLIQCWRTSFLTPSGMPHHSLQH